MKKQKLKRVFHIISHFDVGGAERVAVNIAKSATPGFEYHVVELVRARSPFTSVFIKELEDAGIRYHRAIVPDVRFHYVFERLAALLFPLTFLPLFFRYRPAVVHSHTEVPDMGVVLFFSLFKFLAGGCKVVRTIHNTQLWTGLEATGRVVERFFIRHGSNVAISEAVRKNYMARYGQDAPIIYNGVAETPQVPFAGIVKGKMNILFAGRFEPQKGISTLVEIIKSMASDSRYHFHLVGDGSLRQYAGNELAGLTGVTFHAPIHGLPAYLSSFDYLLMPSEFEGLSILSIEASMARLPVIANRAPGLRDTLPGDWRLMVENNSIGAYKQLFGSIIPSADRAQLGSKAHAFVSSHFGIRRMQERYEMFYNGMK